MIDRKTNEELRLRFNPEGSQLRRLQLRMLGILKAVDGICRRHGISYWLSSGTLIGAARHGGFIPWDDDLDIEMMRSDYLRLLKLLPGELPQGLALQTPETDPAYFYCYAKVRDTASEISETNRYDRAFKYRGAYIDIFPMERQSMAAHLISEKALGHAYKIWRTSTDDRKAMRKIRLLYRANTRLLHPLLRMACKLPGKKTITSGLGMPYHNPRLEEDIFPLTEIRFEDGNFPAPGNTDHLLRMIYGDYGKLPDIGGIKPHTDHVRLF